MNAVPAPLKVLDGKTPREAANDPTLKTRLAGTVLLVEQSFAQPATEGVFGQLRQELNLPAAGPIEPRPGDVVGVPYTRLHRLAVDKLSDEDLVRNFQRAMQVTARQAAGTSADSGRYPRRALSDWPPLLGI